MALALVYLLSMTAFSPHPIVRPNGEQCVHRRAVLRNSHCTMVGDLLPPDALEPTVYVLSLAAVAQAVALARVSASLDALKEQLQPWAPPKAPAAPSLL